MLNKSRPHPYTLASIREAGPYSSRNASKGSLLDEVYLLVTTYDGDYEASKIRSFIMESNGLNKKTYENRRVIWDRLNRRYFSKAPFYIGRALEKTVISGSQSPEFLSLAYLYYALTDKITYDFVNEVIWSKWQSGNVAVSADDFIYFLEEKSSNSIKVSHWSTLTRKRLASNTLAALRDFGLLKGRITKQIQRPPVADETIYHLLAILWAEGKRGNAILQALDWHIFLWKDADVANALNQLAQKQWIRFERSGQTVILEMIRMPELGE
jgi:hypothetical protein